jgi:hypothetical protein
VNYYKIWNSGDINEIGHYPQTKLNDGYNPTLPNSHWQVEANKFPDFTPNYELKLYKNAFPTDYLDADSKPTGIFISRKLKELIQNFRLPPHKFYKIDVFQNEKKLDYYWLHYIVDDFWEYVDLEKSTAKVYHLVNKKYSEIIPITSLNKIEDMKSNLERGFKLALDKIIFKAELPYDLFKISNIIYEPVIISELLRDEMRNHKITGFEAKIFTPISN